MRLYHLAVRRQTWHPGRRRYVDADPVTYTRVTSSPLTHHEAEVMKSKFAEGPRYFRKRKRRGIFGLDHVEVLSSQQPPIREALVLPCLQF